MTEPYDQLILKCLSGIATKAEQQQLDHWSAQSAENRQVLEDYKKVWKLSASSTVPDFNSPGELKKLQLALDQEDNKVRTFKLFKSQAFKVAASITLLMVCTFLLYQVVLKPETIVKESGSEKIQFTLPDGSIVSLNENSKIYYADDFNDERFVKLSGEGFFEVTHNPSKPFVIQADKSEVKVLGTSFNVRAYENEPQNEVFVVTGKVSLADSNDQSIILSPGEEGVLDKRNNTIARTSEPNQNLAAWKTKQLIFRKTSLTEVTETLEKYFQISITVKNPDLQKCRFTSSFKDPTLDEVIEAISIALNINIVHQNKNYTFDGEGC
jgi:transmembrane sensor